MFHTSGTTGRPKLVPHSEARFLAMLASGGVAMGSGPGERMLVGLPLFHVSGALQMGFQTLFNGCSIVIPSPTGLRGEGVIADYWSFISRLRVTLAGVVPTVLMKLAETKPEGDVSSLRYFLCGGAPLPRPIIVAVTRHSGGAAVIEGWGMTETCGLALLNPRDRPRMGTVGVPFMGVEAEIRRWNGKDRVSPSTMVGELVVRGETVITAYLDDQPDLFTADGWLRTGDLARQDEDGYFWIVGRAKDLIIRGGHNIDPATIEGPAYEHPAVELAAAIGRPDRYAGEVPVLYIQLRPDAHVEPAEFQGFLAKRIEERAAIPKAVHILPVMPLNAQGKISKLTLRQEATRAVLQSELDAVCPTATVAVAEDERHGLSVRIAAPPGDRSAAERALSHYPFPILEEA
jgi:fatty-acyl-CoA synthase